MANTRPDGEKLEPQAVDPQLEKTALAHAPLAQLGLWQTSATALHKEKTDDAKQ